jgi:hypothetical protein
VECAQFVVPFKLTWTVAESNISGEIPMYLEAIIFALVELPVKLFRMIKSGHLDP